MIRIGIFGAGRFGQIHMNVLQTMPEFAIAGFYDSDDVVARKAEQEFGLKRFSSEEDLIANCDAVNIVSSTPSHFSLAQKSIRRFRHVFIEKPVTATTEEARILNSMSTEAGVIVQAGHVERFNPAFLAAYPHISNPIFIESHRMAELGRYSENTSVLEDIMVHDIDILLQLINSPIKKISASATGILNNSPDHVNARIEFENGASANLTASRLAVKNMRITRVYQRDSSISINFLENTSGIISRKEGSAEPQLTMLSVKTENAIRTEFMRFAEAIVENKEPAVSLDHAIRALNVAALIKDKLRLQTTFFSERAIS